LGKFDKYKIDLKAMTEDVIKRDFHLDNAFFADVDSPEIQKGRVDVALTVRRTAAAFELSFETNGVVVVTCDRCLDEMDQPVESSDKIMVKFGTEYSDEGDNLVVIPEEEGEINVAWFMFEFIALAIPMKHVHPAGKCNKEMTSRLSHLMRTEAGDDEEFGGEADEADDAERPVDPRWNELKKILDNN
jgi:uncharacterized metal-binding protein YceD (DUF177 family)